LNQAGAGTGTYTRTGVLSLLLAAMALVWLRPVDQVADDYTTAGLQRALTTFAAARGLNALISLVESTSFNVEFGVGATVQPGAVLDPLDDLVEQFSTLMLASTMSFSVQKLLLKVFASWPVCLVISIGLLAWGVLLLRRGQAPPWLPRVALGLLCLRLAVPVVALGNEAVYRFALAGEYGDSQEQIVDARVPDVEVLPDEKLADKLKRWWAQSTDISEKIETLKQTADHLTRHIIRLAVIFFLQTLLLPLLFLWLLLKLYRLLFADALARLSWDQPQGAGVRNGG